MADALPQVLPVSNVIQFPKPVELEPLLLKVKSKEFEALASLVGRDQARVIQHMEFVFNEKKALLVPHDRIYRHITAPAKFPNSPCLLKYMGGSERTLYRILGNVRTSHRFKKGEKFDPAAINYEGKYYYTAYHSKDNRQDKYAESQLYWYRNAKLLHDLYQQVKAIVAAQKKLHAPAKMQCQENTLAVPLAGTLAGTLAVPLAGDKTSTQELQEPQELKNSSESKPQQETSEPLLVDADRKLTHLERMC